jgi:hypothetical protein
MAKPPPSETNPFPLDGRWIMTGLLSWLFAFGLLVWAVLP